MEIREAILSRRSVRAYQDKPIAPQELQEILEAGMHAPSGVNLQPWYFVAIQSKEKLDSLKEVMGRVSKAIEPGLKERFSKNPAVVEETTRFVHHMGGAPVCILAFHFKPDFEDTAGIVSLSIAAAIENMLLAATDKGIGSCWLTAPVEAGVGTELGAAFAPGKGPMVSMITLGYPVQAAKTPPRKAGRYDIV